MDKNMYQTESKELTQAKKLIDKGKLDKAFSILKSFEEKGDSTFYNAVLCNFLKCQVFRFQGLFEKVIKLGEQTYNESLQLGDNFLSIDILLLMAEVLTLSRKFEETYKKVILADERMNRLTEESPLQIKLRKAHIAFQKGYYYQSRNELDLGEVFYKQSIALGEEIGVEKIIAKSLIYISGSYLDRFKLETALKNTEQALHIAEKCEVKWLILVSLNIMGTIFFFKGELDSSIKTLERALAIGRECNNRFWMAIINSNLAETYRRKGELDLALESMEQSYEFHIDIGLSRGIVLNSDFLIEILIDRGDLNRAQQVLEQFKQLNIKWKDKQYSLWYRFCKALVLKTSRLARNRGKAEEILKEILKEDDLSIDIKIRGRIYLSELLLTELQLTNEGDLLEEIKLVITQLLDLSVQSNSFWILGETYLLQAKLALISLNLTEAQKLLIQGQKIAESYGLTLLAQKISNEHDEFLKQSQMWEDIKNSEISITERIKLARIDEQMKNMIRKRIIDTPEPQDEESVLLLIISEGGTPLFSQFFIEDRSFKDHLFGGFLSAVNTFMDEMFSEELDRAIFGEYTLLMHSISPFFLCYVYKGQSYSAQHRLKSFINELQRNKDIWKTIEKYYQTNQEIQINDVPLLDSLIKDIFIEKSIALDLKL
jgi:tetratricopeptide (TPR) repeat protein